MDISYINFLIGDAEITAEISMGELSNGQSTSHFHIYNEIHFIIAGKCELTTKDKTYSVKKGDVIVIPSNALHDIKKCGDGFNRCVVGFSAKKIKNTSNECVYQKFFSQFENMNISIVHCCDFEQLLSELIKHSGKDDLYNKLVQKYYMQLLILKVAEMLEKTENITFSQAQSDSCPTIIIEKYLSKACLNPDANLTELAKLLNLSKKQAERTIKNLTGKNFKKLLMMRRMSEAKELIERTDMKITQIATRVGYNSYESFYRAFMGFYGVSPKVFRV